METNYPDRKMTIDALLEAARSAVVDESLDHPQDIAYAMSAAIEHSWPVIWKLHTDGQLK